MENIQITINGKVRTIGANTVGKTLMEVLIAENEIIDAPCAGNHSCGKCKVIVENCPYSQEESMLLDETERAEHVHLACCVAVRDGLSVVTRQSVNAVILSERMDERSEEPTFIRKKIALPEPAIDDQRDDITRILEACQAQAFRTGLATEVCGTRYGYAYLHHGKLTDVSEGEHGAYGIAVDVGTTTVVGYLYDLLSGECLDVYSALNEQRPFGADVISRVKYAKEKADGLDAVSDAIRKQMRSMTKYFGAKVDIQSIYSVVFTGNTVMMHFLVGANPEKIANAPFTPAFTQRLTLEVSCLGLGLPKAEITVMPCVSGFVGADTVAAALACGVGTTDEITLLVDIGTNGEMVLGNKDKLLACSVAAGPAFEGANIRCGIGGVTGAVDHVNGDMKFTTIGNAEPIGICGSGILDLTAVCVENGTIAPSGRIKNETKTIPLTETVVIEQKDIREIQLAKGAVCAGIQLLLEKFGITAEQVDKLYLAGGFGNYLDPTRASQIGMFPAALLPKVVSAGNAAGRGAVRAMLSERENKRADELKKQIRYLELSAEPRFTELFADAMMLEEV